MSEMMSEMMRPCFVMLSPYMENFQRCKSELCDTVVTVPTWDVNDMSLVVRKRSSGFLTWSDTNWALQSQKMARGLKFCI